MQDLQGYSEALSACGEQIMAGTPGRCEREVEALADMTPAQTPSVRIVPVLGKLTRVAVAAVLVLAAGIAIGRFTTSRPVDVEQLRAEVQASVLASFEAGVQERMLAQMDQRLDLALEANNTQLTGQIVEQMRGDLQTFAADLTGNTKVLIDRRFAEVVELIEAGRLTDRRQVAKAFDQIRTQTGRGLMRLAAMTDETEPFSEN
jgi:uncharacterized protein YdeI (BOF family)